jgi:hypothetical protein
MAQLTLSVESGPETDQQESAELTRRLRQVILDGDVDRVDFLRSGAAPTGAKGDIVSLTTLAVTLAPVALTGLITTLQSWLSRHERATVTVESGGEKLTLTGSLSREQQQAVAAFLDRHKSASTP